MLELRFKDGTTIEPSEATWAIEVPGMPGIYRWADIALLMLLEPTYDVVEGAFGPPGRPGMPIRGVRFTDTSDLQVEVPMPLQVARDMGEILGASEIEVVTALPTSLVMRQPQIEDEIERRKGS